MARNKQIVREVFDLPIGAAFTVKIKFETWQGECSRCGHAKTFLPKEVDEKATATRRFMQYASELCRFMTASETSQILPFSGDAIRRWDKKILENRFGEIDLTNVRKLLIDEKSIGKHHKYVTLVLDGDSGELLFMARGKSRDSLKPFFRENAGKYETKRPCCLHGSQRELSECGAKILSER